MPTAAVPGALMSGTCGVVQRARLLCRVQSCKACVIHITYCCAQLSWELSLELLLVLI